MSTNTERPDWLLHDGHRLLGSGRVRAALSMFSRASLTMYARMNTEELSAALHMRGVCEQILGDFESAERTLMQAYALTSNNVNESRILRDLAVVAMRRGTYYHASALAVLSYEGLLNAGRPYWDTESFTRFSDEASASLGVIAELDILIGRKAEGIDNLWTAYDRLRAGNDKHHLLDATVRLMRYCPQARLSSVPMRGLKLALKARNLRRVGEIVIITVAGRHAYNLIERPYRARQRH